MVCLLMVERLAVHWVVRKVVLMAVKWDDSLLGSRLAGQKVGWTAETRADVLVATTVGQKVGWTVVLKVVESVDG